VVSRTKVTASKKKEKKKTLPETRGKGKKIRKTPANKKNDTPQKLKKNR